MTMSELHPINLAAVRPKSPHEIRQSVDLSSVSRFDWSMFDGLLDEPLYG